MVSNKAQYCSVVRTGIGKTIICLGGEVDASMTAQPPPPPPRGGPRPITRRCAGLISRGLACPVWDSKPAVPGAPINWVELKTSAEICSDRDLDAFERKLLKFWIQSFLLGVPRIVVGFRSRDGTLLKLEEMETAGIPATVQRRGRAGWDGNACINFASALLECQFASGLA